MTQSSLSLRPFVVGTTGWTAEDLDDPAIEPLWESGSYEIIEGALVNMAPAYYDSTKALQRLVRTIQRHLEDQGQPADFAFEPDVILSRTRVVKPDAIWMSPADERKQKKLNRGKVRHGMQYGRLIVPPTLVIENISIGHESQDRVVKRRWYAEAGVANYWILDAFARSLECLALEGRVYRLDARGTGKDEVRPALLPGLVISLKDIWAL
jgi:Uma2 family endonuclease